VLLGVPVVDVLLGVPVVDVLLGVDEALLQAVRAVSAVAAPTARISRPGLAIGLLVRRRPPCVMYMLPLQDLERK